MSGFLASLAARSTGQARVLEPRRLLFEPRDEPVLDAGPIERAGPEPIVESRGAATPRASAEPAHEQPPSLPGPDPAPEPDAPDDEMPPAAAATPAARPRRRPRSAAPARGREQPAVRHGARPEPEESRLTEAAQPRASPVPRPAAPRPVRAGLAEQAAVARRQALRAPPTAAEGSSAPEHVVRITIGRVDVRAVQEPGARPEPARPAPPPRMTLEEYLARGRLP